MPTILKTDIGDIKMPDEWSADQIKDWAHTRLPTIREGLKKGPVADLASRIPRDYSLAAAGLVQGIARGPYAAFSPSETSVRTNLRQLGLQAAMAADPEKEQEIVQASRKVAKEAEIDPMKLAANREALLAKDPLYKLGEQTKQAAREIYAVNPEREGSALAIGSQALTSTLPVIAAAPLGVPGMMLTYGAMSGQQGAEEAIEAGRPDKADAAYLAYAGLGALSEAALGYPVALIRKIRAARQAGVPAKEFGQAFKQTLAEQGKAVGREMLKASGREAVQESTEQFGQNLVARDLVAFDPKRELTQGVLESFIAGGVVGGLFGGAFGTAQAIDNQPKNQLDRLLKEYGLDLRPIDPRLADIEAREGMRPEMAQRTVVPAMLQPEPPITSENIRTVEPTAEPPAPRRRRPIAPAPERPRFRPPPVQPNVQPAIPPEQEAPVSPTSAAPPVAQPMVASTAGTTEVRTEARPATTPITPQEEQDAIRQRQAKEVSAQEQAEARPQVGAQVRPVETPQAQGQVISTQDSAGTEVNTQQAQPSFEDVTPALLEDLNRIPGTRYKPIVQAKPAKQVSKTESNLLAKLPNELSLGYVSNALVFSDAVRGFSKPEQTALIKLVKRGSLAVQKRSIGGKQDYVLVKQQPQPTVETMLDPQRPVPNIKLLDVSADEISRTNLEQARAAVVAQLGPSFGTKVFRWVSPVLSNEATAIRLGLGEDSRRAIEGAFSKRITFFDSEYPINGLILSDLPDTIFLNVRSRKPLSTVIFHELMEHLRLQMPEDYARFVQVLGEEMMNFESYARIIETISGQTETRDHILKELAADFAAYESQRPDFWNRMAERIGPSFARIGQTILRWLNGVVQRIRGFETTEFFRDVERVRNELANVIAKFAQQSISPTTPAGEGQAFFQLDEIYSNKQNLDNFIQTPYISQEEAQSLRQQAGAQAALVPDAIADEIRSLDAADPVENRMASLLEFILRIHGLAPALEIRRILADTSLPDDLKHAAISGVLRQIEHVKVKTTEIDDLLQQATKNLAAKIKAMGKIGEQQLIEANAGQMAQNLVTGYRAYLTAQAAGLPADKNVASARQELLNRLNDSLTKIEQTPDATIRALQAIASRIGELPISEGPATVIEAIRSKGILRGVVGESVADFLLDEKPGGLPPLLLNPQTNELLQQLAELQKKAATYAKQIEMVEQAFRGKGEPTAVDLRKWAETYRKFRNKQAEAAKAITQTNKDLREADQSVEVYSRSVELLERLQNDPLFKAQFEAVENIPGGSIFNDILKTDPLTRETMFTSPLKQEDGTQNKYRVLLAPDRQADEQTMREMALLVHEIDDYLAGEGGNAIDAKTWKDRAEFIRKYQLIPFFATTTQGWSFETGHGIIDLNPLTWVQTAFGGRVRAPRTEAEKMTVRAADAVNTTYRVGDQSLNGFRLLRNNREFGDEASKVAVLEAVKSHGWDYTRIDHWNEYVLNPIIASGQSPGQMRLGVGDYIPGTGIQITKEDMRAARLQKRFSQGIVQTTQGTAQNLPPLLRDNPILVQDQFAGRTTLRAAFGTGPLTMARRFSDWARGFAYQWSEATPEARRRLIADGRGFRLAVLGYITTTNQDFEYKSPLKPVYAEYTALARTENEMQVQSLDELTERMAEIAVAKGMFETTAEAQTQIDQILLREMDQIVQAYNVQLTEQAMVGNKPQAVVVLASAKNSFTTARHKMVAPDTFYDYTLTAANDRIAFVAGAYQMFQSKQISALQDLQAALNRERVKLEKEISDLAATGMGEKRAFKEVQQRTKKEQELGQRRYTYSRLVQHNRVIDKLVDDMSKLVVDARDENDAAALFALSRFRSTMSSSLLASPIAMSNNLFGGGIAASWVTMQNLGRARLLLPIKSTVNLAATLPKRFLASYPSRTAIGKLARSNLPLLNELAQLLEQAIVKILIFDAEMQVWGLRSPPDMRNRLTAAGELKWTAGQIVFGKTPLLGKIANQLESLPVVRQLLIHLRDKSPRVIDEWVNQATAETYRSEMFDRLKKLAVTAFTAREELAKKTGENIGDFTKYSNLLTPEELELPKASGYRDITRLRQLFQLVGTLDGFLLDYYKRYKAAPEGERAAVPLFTDQAALGSVIFDMEAHGNIPTPGFTPPAMIGVGQSGVIKSLLFMFQNYVLRMGAQIERLTEKDLRDPKVLREAYGFWSLLIALVIFLFAGLLATETGVRATKVLTGRAPSRVTLANVAADPSVGMVARYTGMALANNLPYYGKVISEMLGNPGYGSWWDAANMIPVAGLVRDSSIALKRIGQTGDVIWPGLDFVSRWMPPASPFLRLLPGVEGDIEAKNAARALRVVGPSQGMELAGGGGANYAQTPVTPEIRNLLSAAYRGDAAGIQRAFDAAVREKELLGSPDPVRAVKQSLAAAVPARKVFGRAITADEEAGLIGQMSGAQREGYAGAREAFDLINQTLGTNYRLTAAPPKVTGTTRTSRRRSLRGGLRRLPSVRRDRSRRSPFGRYRLRRLTGRRKRRSPAFSLAA